MKIFCQNCGTNLKEGVVICPKCGFENTIIKSKSEIIFISIGLVVILLLIGLSTYVWFKGYVKIPFLPNKALLTEADSKKCTFEISDLKKYRFGGSNTNAIEAINTFKKFKSAHNVYTPMQEEQTGWGKDRTTWELNNYRWFLFEGVIKNTSPSRQFLKQMAVKLYTPTDIFLGQGYGNGDVALESRGETKGIWIDSNTSVPFKVGIKVENEDLIRSYIDTNTTFKESIYPWFETCEY